MPSLRDEIVEIITRTTKPQVPDLSDDNRPLLQAGLDSLDYASVLMAIEDRYRLEILEDDMENLGSLNDIITFVEARVSRTP
jgi:acyl carrier protein